MGRSQRVEVSICKQQYGFMPRKSTTEAVFTLRLLTYKYREGQGEQHCAFGRRGTVVLCEEVWSARKSCYTGTGELLEL